MKVYTYSFCIFWMYVSILAIHAGATRSPRSTESYGTTDVYAGVAILAWGAAALVGALSK